MGDAMGKMILHPTDVAQWHSLVHEAQASCQLILGEELESYLVFLLKRFTTKADLASSILALEYLYNTKVKGSDKQYKLRDIGDKCLLFSGLFPGRARRANVKISYFVDLGQMAYSDLSEIGKADLSELFSSLAQEFVPLMDVLQSIRVMAGDRETLLPLEAAELWMDTHSQQARESLNKYTDALPLFTENFKDKKRG